MSGAGYYKYRCKYWMTYNCPNWVWVNNAPCAHCLADGRDRDSLEITPLRVLREVCVPQFDNGLLRYVLIELAADSNGNINSEWIPKAQPEEVAQPFLTPTQLCGGCTALSKFEVSRGL